MKKKFDIRKTFETFLREPLSILTEGLFQIVNIQANIFNQESSFSIDFIKNKTIKKTLTMKTETTTTKPAIRPGGSAP